MRDNNHKIKQRSFCPNIQKKNQNEDNSALEERYSERLWNLQPWRLFKI